LFCRAAFAAFCIAAFARCAVACAWSHTVAFSNPTVVTNEGGACDASDSVPALDAAGRAAINGMTRTLARELGPSGIRVNCIHPGLIDTDMTAWVMKDPELLPVVLAQISMGRAGQPREIGMVAAFLASDAANYVTGQSIFVDGGWEGK